MPPWEGGADVIIIDDPQLPWLIPLIKEQTPNRPVIFRSHIQIRSDLVDTPGTPQAETWKLLWDAIKQADLFISHPVRAFVPKNVPQEKLGYMPASTDWLDGLNKPMTDWITSYYGRIFNSKCRERYMPNIAFPNGGWFPRALHPTPPKPPKLIEARGLHYPNCAIRPFQRDRRRSCFLRGVPQASRRRTSRH
jgi:alpha,alpha-trehalose phosphorylase (configuration-retaining)